MNHQNLAIEQQKKAAVAYWNIWRAKPENKLIWSRYKKKYQKRWALKPENKKKLVAYKKLRRQRRSKIPELAAYDRCLKNKAMQRHRLKKKIKRLQIRWKTAIPVPKLPNK